MTELLQQDDAAVSTTETAWNGQNARNASPDPTEEGQNQFVASESADRNGNSLSYLEWDDDLDDDDEASDIKSQAVFSVATGMSATVASDIKSLAVFSQQADMSVTVGSTSVGDSLLGDEDRTDRTFPSHHPGPTIGSIRDDGEDNTIRAHGDGTEPEGALREDDVQGSEGAVESLSAEDLTSVRVGSLPPESPNRPYQTPPALKKDLSIDIVVHPEDFLKPLELQTTGSIILGSVTPRSKYAKNQTARSRSQKTATMATPRPLGMRKKSCTFRLPCCPRATERRTLARSTTYWP
jgi:hypothetical protein